MFRDNNQSNLVSSNIISYSHDNIDIVAKIKFKGKRKRKYKKREEKKIWKKMRRNEAKKKRIYSRAYMCICCLNILTIFRPFLFTDL